MDKNEILAQKIIRILVSGHVETVVLLSKVQY